MTDLAALSAAEMTSGYASGDFTPLDVLEAVEARAHAMQPRLNPFCRFDPEGARTAAVASLQRWRAGRPYGALDGVPVSVKDMILTAGMATLKGSKTVDPAGPWTEDAPSVARLRGAGAVIFGKTTTTEFGGSPFSTSPLTGPTNNAWNAAYGNCGSSMGAAAQIAGGAGPLALANDAAGSIRMPASFGGCFGIKPTYGLVANYPPSAAGNLGHVGPMSWTVADAAAMLSVIAGPDPRDPDALPPQFAALIDEPIASVRGLRIAYSRGLGIRDPEAEVAAAVDAAAIVFEELGATVEEVDPDLSGLFAAYDVLRICNRAAGILVLPAEERAKLDPVVARVAEMAERFTVSDYVNAIAERQRLKRVMLEFHSRYDILLTPTMAVLPHRQGIQQAPGDMHWYEMNGEVWAPYTFAFNMTQQPAANVVCGLTGPDSREAPGLPIGLQIVAAPFQDALVLNAAAAFEAARPVRRPVFAEVAA
ncbi:amidase [Acuticoccus sediminis]|uniref:Amidase n=1 Tax=Acuticoccus sediminis TaxID=2184697 RepID=A0A8B2NZQ9_9HYPH|nr:amidase family protein [Acuticoccus sediminis]RAI04200.1 amidase [Acuticoccus sediminis]